MRTLLALYPRAWRRRYGAEFAALLDEQGASPGVLLDTVLGAIDAHLDPQLADEGETLLRRRMKDVVMKSLRAGTALTMVGLLLPVAMMAGAYLSPELRHGGFVVPLTTAFATGLLVGRWWAPFPFVIVGGVWLLLFAQYRSAEALNYYALVMIAWVAVCLIGVGARAIVRGGLAQLRRRGAAVRAA